VPCWSTWNWQRSRHHPQQPAVIHGYSWRPKLQSRYCSHCWRKFFPLRQHPHQWSASSARVVWLCAPTGQGWGKNYSASLCFWNVTTTCDCSLLVCVLRVQNRLTFSWQLLWLLLWMILTLKRFWNRWKTIFALSLYFCGHWPWPWAALALASKTTGLGLGLGLENQWPWPWPCTCCPRTHPWVYIAQLVTTSNVPKLTR